MLRTNGGGSVDSVTVTDPASGEVLVGHEATLQATITGDPIGGGWDSFCPGVSKRPNNGPGAPDLEKTISCPRVGEKIHRCCAVFEGWSESEAEATVTTVGPNEVDVTGYDSPSSGSPEGQYLSLLVKPVRGGEQIGEHAEVIDVEFRKEEWDSFNNRFDETDGWRRDQSAVSYDPAFRGIIHGFSNSCAYLDTLPDGQVYTEPVRYQYRITIAGDCNYHGGRTFTLQHYAHVQRKKGTGCRFTIIETTDP